MSVKGVGRPEAAALPGGSPGVRHALQVFTSPRDLFARVVDTGTYGWSLVTLIGLVMLIGYAEVATGLIDHVVDQQTEQGLARLEQQQAHLVDRIELKGRMDDVRKTGEFNKLLARLGAIGLAPAYMLASLLLISSFLYAAVALTGRKPEYHTLMSICVYSAFVTLAACALRLTMVVSYRTTQVDTSMGMLAEVGKPTVLSAVDPFRIWFWALVATGLVVTRQLSRRMAIVTCALLAITAAGIRVGMSFAASS